MNVTVRNVITSMRLISWFDWAEFVEGLSVVDKVLRDGSSFGRMDFATRDRYRHAIEKLAQRSGRTEMEVARQRCCWLLRPARSLQPAMGPTRRAEVARKPLQVCPEGRWRSHLQQRARLPGAWTKASRPRRPTP